VAIEIRGTRGSVGAALGLGLLVIAIGAIIRGQRDVPAIAGWITMGVGALAVALAARALFRRAPQLRASDDGLTLGGRFLPWGDVKQIYVGRMKVRAYGMSTRTESLAIDFHRRRTLFRWPISFWIGSPFAVGDVDVSLARASGRGDVIASRLEAMRVRSSGTEEAATVGASELPAARLVERDS
jgi:hypothetical protein